MNKFWAVILVMLVIASLLIDDRSVKHCIPFNSLKLTKSGHLTVYYDTYTADSKNE